MKKIIASLLCVLMLFSSFAVFATSEKKTVEFGSYPQTLVTDADLISELEAADAEFVSYGYYDGVDNQQIGAEASDYMKYADVELNGEKYRGVRIDEYRPYYSWKRDDSHQQTNGYSPENTYWFRFEPLSWIILDEKTGFAVSEKIIDAQGFNPGYYYDGTDDGEFYTDINMTAKANIFDASDLCRLLNEEFAACAFSSEELSEINKNGNNTVSLLSYAQVTDEKFFDSDSSRKASGTDYAECQGLYVSNGFSNWLLTDAAESIGSTLTVKANGSADGESYIYDVSNGIRAAIFIDSVIPEYTFKWINAEGEFTAVYREGDSVTAPSSGEKEGYSFIGWSEKIPETMPDHDVTVIAKYQINTYKAVWHMNGTTVTTESNYGEAVNIPRVIMKENSVFDGWDNEVPKKMPAHDLEFTALYSDAVPVSLKWKSYPTASKYYYKSASSPDLSGIAVDVVYSNGTVKTITNTSKFTVSGFDTASTGIKTVSVGIGDLSISYTVNVSYAWWQTLIRILLLGFLWY